MSRFPTGSFSRGCARSSDTSERQLAPGCDAREQPGCRHICAKSESVRGPEVRWMGRRKETEGLGKRQPIHCKPSDPLLIRGIA